MVEIQESSYFELLAIASSDFNLLPGVSQKIVSHRLIPILIMRYIDSMVP